MSQTFFRKFRSPMAYFGAYVLWVLLVKLLALTLLTYFMRQNGASPGFMEIQEGFASNELSFIGLGSLLFVLLLFSLHPLLPLRFEEFWSLQRFRLYFLPGLFHGAFLTAGFMVILILTRQIEYHGSPIHAEETSLIISAVLLRTFMLVLFIYCEEFIFRHRLTKGLQANLAAPKAALVTAVLYCGLKLIQFDLGIIQLVTLFLISTSLSLRTAIDKDFVRAAGFYAGIFIIIQPVFGLPVLGSEFSGLFLIQPTESTVLNRIITGGRGGPLSSHFFQLLLLIDIGRSYRKYLRTKTQNQKLSLVKEKVSV